MREQCQRNSALAISFLFDFYFPAQMFLRIMDIRCGVVFLADERQVAVYVPNGYETGTVCPFIVVHDGMGYVKTMTPTLDALIEQRRIPKMVAIFLNSGGSDAQGSQRGLEYDTMDGRFADFVDEEVGLCNLPCPNPPAIYG